MSGLGYVGGWKCTAGTLTFTIDNGPSVPLSYGSSRADTQSVCGKVNTGSIAQINWNLAGNGSHTIRLYDNGVQFAQATFTVTTLGTEFLTGQSGSTTLNFAGKSVTLTWQENQQNFVITSAASAGFLYTGVTSQGTTACGPTSIYSGTSCQARFNIAPTLDMLSPSPLVDEILTTHACSSGPVLLFIASCGNQVISDRRCSTLPITNGHWEAHAKFADSSFTDIVADCMGNTCSGTYNTSTTASASCVTGTLTWTATKTGAAAAAAEEGTAQGLEGIEGYGQPIEGVQVEVNKDGDVKITVPGASE